MPNASAERWDGDVAPPLSQSRCYWNTVAEWLRHAAGRTPGRGKSGAFGVERNGTLALKWPAPYHDAGYYRGWSMRRSQEEIIAAASQMIR